MSIQGALENLMKLFIGFYIACMCAGRPDIPFKLIMSMRAKAIAGTSASWGCPAIENRNSCWEYKAGRYRK